MIKIANAPCSWGVLEFESKTASPGYAQVLDEIAQTGYVGTELGDWGFMPTDPAALRDELERRGLDMVGAFVTTRLVDSRSYGETSRARRGNGAAAGLGRWRNRSRHRAVGSSPRPNPRARWRRAV